MFADINYFGSLLPVPSHNLPNNDQNAIFSAVGSTFDRKVRFEGNLNLYGCIFQSESLMGCNKKADEACSCIMIANLFLKPCKCTMRSCLNL